MTKYTIKATAQFKKDYKPERANNIFENNIKQCLGATFGYIFCVLLEYKKKENITCKIANIRSASRFIKEAI